MKFNSQRWLKITLINLLIVAFLGALMRYKIGFSFPFFSQKNILHAHSHFAFLGWVTQGLYILLIGYLQEKVGSINVKRYTTLLTLNLTCAVIMLISFFIQGYGLISISFSTLSIVLACVFAYHFFKDLSKIQSHKESVPWFKAALWFNLFSSIGTFYLAYMMVSHNFNERWYLAAVYYYLHFQYNGFFFFTIMGLSIYKLPHFLPSYSYSKQIFNLFLASVIPAYFLSTLWANLPVWLYVIVVLAAFVQTFAWIKFVQAIRVSLSSSKGVSNFVKYLILFVFAACSIKFILQLGSTIPQISKLAFGFRPIVIAYLHLILLAVISFFILAYIYTFKLIHVNKSTTIALSVFSAGVLLNETVLGVQGIASFSYLPVPFVNESLFVVSLVLLLGALLLVLSQLKKVEVSDKQLD